MPKRILRSFLYLDEAIVDDYLAQYEGGILDGPYTTKDTTVSGGEAGAGLKIGFLEGGGKGNTSSSTETSQTFRMTNVAKFTHLYDYMKQDEAIQALNGFDEAIYKQIEHGEIVEVRGTAKLPQWEHLTNMISTFSGLADVMRSVGQDPLTDPETNQAFKGFSELVAKKAQEDIELIITPVGAPSFKFVARLDRARLLRRKDELEAEITIIGKVRRKLGKGETIDVFRVAPRLDQFKDLNRVQRRGMKQGSAKLPSTDSLLDEVIKYPAMEIQAIAIYQ